MDFKRQYSNVEAGKSMQFEEEMGGVKGGTGTGRAGRPTAGATRRGSPTARSPLTSNGAKGPLQQHPPQKHEPPIFSSFSTTTIISTDYKLSAFTVPLFSLLLEPLDCAYLQHDS